MSWAYKQISLRSKMLNKNQRQFCFSNDLQILIEIPKTISHQTKSRDNGKKRSHFTFWHQLFDEFRIVNCQSGGWFQNSRNKIFCGTFIFDITWGFWINIRQVWNIQFDIGEFFTDFFIWGSRHTWVFWAFQVKQKILLNYSANSKIIFLKLF